LEERESFQLDRNDGIFAAAFPYDINYNGSEGSTPSIEEDFKDYSGGRLERT